MKTRIARPFLFIAALSMSMATAPRADAAAQRALSAGINVYVRPGGISYPFTILTESAGGGIQDMGFQNVTAFSWILTRARIESSTDGVNWTQYTIQNDNVSAYLAVSGRLWRVVDLNAGDSTTSNAVGMAWHPTANPASVTTTGGNVFPDTAPTDITSSTFALFNDAAPGSTVATLTPTDVGDTIGGYWALESQSVPNLFTLTSDTSAGNTATLKVGTGSIPAVGQTVTVTVRYYDLYQTDSTGSPIGGQGFSKTLSYTVVQDSTTDLGGFGSEFSVNTFTTGNQNQASIARLSTGNFVVVWRSQTQDNDTGSNGGIYARVFSQAGVAQSAEFRISPLDNVNQTVPSVAGLSGGGFVVAYQEASNANDVIFRIVAADNTVGAAQTAHATTALSQSAPRVASLSDGNFVISWVDAANSSDIVARVFSGSGATVASEFTVNTTTAGAQTQPDVSALGSGGFVVTWRGDANSGDIYARTANASGGVSGEFVVATGSGNQINPRVAAFSDGKFVIAWSEPGLDGDASNESNVYFQRYTAASTTAGSVTRANNDAFANQTAPAITGFSDGSFLLAWTSTVQDGELNGIFGRRFSSAGAAQDADDFQINERRHYSQTVPGVSAGSSGAFAASWVDSAQEGSGVANPGVEARVFVPALAPTVTTPTSASVTATGATLGGNATADGGSAITVRGVVYSVTTTNNDPQIGGSGVINATAGSGTGVFTAPVAGLSSATGYSFKAYATNAGGTSYTSVSTFTTLSACPTITLAALPNGIVGSSYSASATASGGTGPYSYALTAGALPTNITRSGAALSGTPTAAGTFTFDITATDLASPGTCTGTRSYSVVIGSVVNVGDLVIREFRSRGPAGIHDEYVEIANRAATPLTIAASDGSAGFGIASESLGLLTTIPNGTVIPVGGFYLAANNTPTTGYSLANYGGASASSPNATWTTDLPDNTGIGLFKSSTTFTGGAGGTVLDAVGFVGSALPYRETNGLPTTLATGTSEAVYARNEPTGILQDTGDNAADFYLGDTNAATFAPVAARLAAPGPQNVTSERATGLTFTLADPTKSPTTFPNRYRVGITATTGTYYFRWKVTNNTGAAITKLRIRVSDVTTKNSPGYSLGGTQADFRLVTSADAAMTVPAAVTALALTVEPPPTGLPLNGGYNASAVATLPGGTLANGASVYVNVAFKYEQAGSYSYFVSGEGK